MIKSVVFDLGNVLVDLQYERGFAKFGAYCRLPPAEAMARLAGLSRRTNLGQLDPWDFYQEARTVLELSPEADFHTFRAIYGGIFGGRPGMGRLLRALAPRYRLGVCSNTDMIHLHAILEEFAYVRIPTVRVLSYEVGLMKPDPRIYELLLERLGTAPEETVFLDDLEENVAAARRLGIRALRVETEAQARAALAGAGVVWEGK